MNDSNESSFLNEYREAVKQKRTARYTIVGVLLSVILVFVFLFYSAITSFSENDLPLTFKHIQKEVKPIAGQLPEKVLKMASNVLPVYLDSVTSELNNKGDVIQDSFMVEVAKLNDFSEQVFPVFEREIREVIENQEVIIYEELSKILGNRAVPEQVERIAIQYRIAAEKKLAELLQETLNDHMEVAEQIHQQAKELAQRKDLVKNPVDTIEGIGIVLEIIGYDLQGEL